MEFPEFGSLLLVLESILSSLKNLEPFLNIYKDSGVFLVFLYRLIIVLKTLFVINALNTAIPLKWTRYCMLIGLLTVVFMKQVSTFEPGTIFILSALGFHRDSMTFMGIMSMTNKPYEFLIDIFTLLCTIYYAIEAYRKEIWKLFMITVLCAFQTWQIFKILSQPFDFSSYCKVMGFSRLYVYLKPKDDIFENRMLYFNIVLCSWVFYKGCQHYDRTYFAPPQAVYRTDVCMRFERELMLGKCYLNSSLEFWDDNSVKALNPSESYDSDVGVNFQKVLPVENMNNVKEQKKHYGEMFNYGVTRTDVKNIDSDKLMKYEIEKDFEPPLVPIDIWNLEKDIHGFPEESFIEVLSNEHERPLNLAHLDEGAEENNQDNSKLNQEEKNVDLDNSPCETCMEDKKASLPIENSVLNKRFGYVKSVKKDRRLENKKNNWKKLNYKLESSNNFENFIADFDHTDEVPSKYGSYQDNYSKKRKDKKINKTLIKDLETTQDKGAKKTRNSAKSGSTNVGFKVKDGKTVENRARSTTTKNSEQVVNKVKLPKIKQTRVAFKATKHETPEFEENEIIQSYLI